MNELIIKHKKVHTIPVIKLTGAVTSHTIEPFSKSVTKALKKNSSLLVIDLSEVEYIDSHGLGIFVYTWKMVEEMQKKLIFYCPAGTVRDIFMDTNLHKIVPITDSMDSF